MSDVGKVLPDDLIRKEDAAEKFGAVIVGLFSPHGIPGLEVGKSRLFPAFIEIGAPRGGGGGKMLLDEGIGDKEGDRPALAGTDKRLNTEALILNIKEGTVVAPFPEADVGQAVRIDLNIDIAKTLKENLSFLECSREPTVGASRCNQIG